MQLRHNVFIRTCSKECQKYPNNKHISHRPLTDEVDKTMQTFAKTELLEQQNGQQTQCFKYRNHNTEHQNQKRHQLIIGIKQRFNSAENTLCTIV